MFRKDDVAVSEWSPENVEVCWKRQRDILTDIWPTLRPGGLLIYSTCTFNTQEDEENVRWMMDELGAELLPISIDDSWGITPSLVPDVPHAYRFLPGRTRGEGFFLAVVRKGEGASVADAPRGGKGKKKDKKGKQPAIAVPTECKQWLADSSSYTYKVIGTEVVALPCDMEPLYAVLSEQLYLIKAGITLAELKGRDTLPTHDLAMSTALRAEAFASCELSYAEALRYLRREAITLPADTPRGFVLVTYRDVPLGFVKNLGNRANNLYPNEWRIRSGHLPEDEVQVINSIS
jgi:NOL1/NOP2/fmu family ribosome biogenesis protein